jgi:hypothetical protein
VHLDEWMTLDDWMKHHVRRGGE